MSKDEFLAIVKMLSSVTWAWDEAAFSDIAMSLHPYGVLRSGQIGVVSLSGEHRLDVVFSGKEVLTTNVLLELTGDLYHLSDNQYNREDERMIRRFHECVDWVAGVLGAPQYKGNLDDEDYPEDEGASWVAYWNLNNTVMKIGLMHNDDNGPIDLSLFFDPPISLLPSNTLNGTVP